MIAAALAAAVPILACWCLLRVGRRGSGAGRVVEAGLAVACGASASAMIYLASCALAGPPGPGLVAVESLIWAAAVVLARALRREVDAAVPAPTHPRPPGWAAWLWVPLAGAGVAAAYSALTHYRFEPHGDWDAIAMWNAKARFLALGGEGWRGVFSAEVAHPDYPLLLPAGIARGWLYAGRPDTRVPFAVGLAATATTCAVLASIVARARGLAAGLLAGLALLSAGPVLVATASQYADIPLALFMLSAVAALVHRDQGGGVASLVAAGWLGGAAAATKNEGVLFLGALLAARFAQVAWARGWASAAREVGLLLVAAAPGLAVQLYGKAMSGARNDLMAGQGQSSTLSRLADPGRYAQVASAALRELAEWRWVLIGLGGYAVVVTEGRRRRERVAGLLQCWLVVGLMAGGYALVYVTTPNHLGWHLGSSISRLAVHLWPLFLLATFLTLQSPEVPRDQPRRGDVGGPG